jgi:hypothetical protein
MGSRKNLGLAALLQHGLDARVGVNGHTPRLGEPFPTGAKRDLGKCRAPDRSCRSTRADNLLSGAYFGVRRSTRRWREQDSNPRSPCGGWRLGLLPRSYGTFSRGLQLRKTATRKANVTFIAFPLGERQRVLEWVRYPDREHSNQCQKAKSHKGCSCST